MPPKFSRPLRECQIFPRWAKDQVRTSPCEANCPAGNPIQTVSSLIADDRIEEAMGYLISRNPFPGITGRVCARPCEQACNRQAYDERISIRSLERFASDNGTIWAAPKKMNASGKRLAIIGSGPAGMTCAYFSALLGHDVTVFESSPIPGGIPRMAIPDFWLPKDIVERELGRVLSLGVQVHTNTTVGKDLAFDDVRKKYDACLIAVGAGKQRRLDIPGASLALDGVSFLKQVNLGHRKPPGSRVVILGGGGVAFDCAFTAKRLGAIEVHIICVEGEDCMCVADKEIQHAQAEDIRIHYSHTVSDIVVRDAKAVGVRCFEIDDFKFDDSCRLAISPASGKTVEVDADTVISAVGCVPDFTFDKGLQDIVQSPGGALDIDSQTMATNLAGVFAAGDAASGPSSVAAAIGSGRRAALSINDYLKGADRQNNCTVIIDDGGQVCYKKISGQTSPHVVAIDEIFNIEAHEKMGRQSIDGESKASGALTFAEIEAGYDIKAARAEAERCFHCGNCTACGNCVTDCPGLILEMTPRGPRVAYPEECWHCGCCRIACPSGAVYYKFPLNMMV